MTARDAGLPASEHYSFATPTDESLNSSLTGQQMSTSYAHQRTKQYIDR
jgi:hypothetical protein